MQKLNSFIIKFAATLFIILLCFILYDNERVIINKEIVLETDTLVVTAVIKIVEHKILQEQPYTIFYGKIELKNAGQDTIIFKIPSLRLCSRSECVNTYYDTIASVIYMYMKFPPKVIFKADVYWAFEGATELKELNNMKLSVTEVPTNY